MTSIFDQYEQDSYHSVIRSKSGQALILGKDEEPIFFKEKTDILPQDCIVTHGVVSNDFVALVTSNNVLMRFDLRKGSKLSEIELSRMVPGVKLTGLFLDPTANHLLISFSTELLYQYKKFPKPKAIARVRGQEVTAVGWHPQGGTASSTRPLLLGTSRGLIIELELTAEETYFPTSSLDMYYKQVFDIGKGGDHAITGLEYRRVGESDTYFVIATTCNRLYRFVGVSSSPEERPLLQQLFNKYLSVPEGFQEIPSQLKFSVLELRQPRAAPPTLAWLTQTGVFCAQIEAKKEENMLIGTRMLSVGDQAPLGMLLTEFHILLLYPHYLVGLSILSEEPVFQDHYNEAYGKLLKITKDIVKDTIWVFAERAVFRYKVTEEDRHVWKIYAERGMYEEAKKFCRDPTSLDEVLVKQAEALFAQSRWEESAEQYADTQSSFEGVVLKFLQVDQHQALTTFLSKKLMKLEPTEKAQETMLVLWILELMLARLGHLHNTREREKLQAELRKFLKHPKVQDCVWSHRSAVYSLMGSRGDEEDLLRLADTHRDYHRLITHHLHKANYTKALDVLVEQKSKDLWYKFAGVLVEKAAGPTLRAMMEQGSLINPARILPSLLAADTDQVGDMIRYLEFCISNLNCQEKAVHNYLLSLYAEHRPDRLMKYLAMQGEDASMVNYDIGYGVRVCREHGRTSACVQLSGLLGLWESAVELALGVSVELAKQTASNSPPHLARKLWLKIAQHVVRENNDIAQAMEFLKQCEQIKIEDILPFFSDFVTIDYFKDAICSSLQEYNQHIQEVKEEMEDATKSAEAIRKEIMSFRKNYVEIKGNEECCICLVGLLLRPFYAFPCGHRFHADCLSAHLAPAMTPDLRQKLTQLQRELISGGNGGVKEAVKAQVDSLLASQCLYCGDHAINLISKQFFEESDYERIRKEWE